MEDNPDSTLPFWNRRVVDGLSGNMIQEEVEEKPPSVFLPGPDGHDVRVEVSRLPAFTDRHEQDAHGACLLPDGIVGDELEKVFDQMLNLILILLNC